MASKSRHSFLAQKYEKVVIAKSTYNYLLLIKYKSLKICMGHSQPQQWQEYRRVTEVSWFPLRFWVIGGAGYGLKLYLHYCKEIRPLKKADVGSHPSELSKGNKASSICQGCICFWKLGAGYFWWQALGTFWERFQGKEGQWDCEICHPVLDSRS